MTVPSARSLPSREQPQASADVTLPLSETARDVPQPIGGGPRTRAERIAAATARGGLETTPVSFDDADGDWQVISSPSFFERLYLDGAQSSSITTAIVQRNYTVLRAFWDEKIAAMQTGAAKTQILIKFGGPHRSEELVRSYPRELKKAADVLSSAEAIAAYRQELETRRREAARKALEPLLAFIFVNEALEPAETDTFLRHAVAAGLTIDEAAEWLYGTIVENDFQPAATPVGESPAERLRSVPWLSQTRMDRDAQVAAAAATASVPQATPLLGAVPVSPGGSVPFRGRSIVAGAVLVVAGVLAIRAMFNHPQSVSENAVPVQLVTTHTMAAPAATAAAPQPIPAATQPFSAKEEPEPPRVDTAVLALEEMRQQLTISRHLGIAVGGSYVHVFTFDPDPFTMAEGGGEFETTFEYPIPAQAKEGTYTLDWLVYSADAPIEKGGTANIVISNAA